MSKKNQRPIEVVLKIVYLILHGEKWRGADPGHTRKGRRQVESLRKFLPGWRRIRYVAAGVGKRHREISEFLNLGVSAWCPDLGGPQSLEPDKVHVCLADGTIIPFEMLRYSPRVGEAVVTLLASLPNGAICLTGRPIARSVGIDPRQFPSASVWRFTIRVVTKGDKIVRARIVKRVMVGRASDDIGGGKKEV